MGVGAMNYKKLGHFSVDDNLKTSHQAREMKTVYAEATCQYLKICFLKNHQNDKNMFNQVGLVSLRVFGYPLGNYESSMIKGQVSEAQNQDDIRMGAQ
jgi:hypothetical protein